MLYEATDADRSAARRAAERTAADVQANQRTDSPAYQSPDYQSKWELDRFQADYMGALAEIAVANLLGLEWGGFQRDAVDVGDCIEVRRLNHPSNGLLIRPKDIEDERIEIHVPVFIFPDETTIDVCGWVPTSVAWEKGHDCVCRRRGACCRVFTDSNTLSIHGRHWRIMHTLKEFL